MIRWLTVAELINHNCLMLHILISNLHWLQVLLSIFLLMQFERQQVTLNRHTVLIYYNHVGHLLIRFRILTIGSCYCHLSIECSITIKHDRLTFFVHKLHVLCLLQVLMLLLKVKYVLCEASRNVTRQLSLVAFFLLQLLLCSVLI